MCSRRRCYARPENWDGQVLRRGENDPLHGPWKHPALQTRLTIALGGGQEYAIGRRKVDNGNSG